MVQGKSNTTAGGNQTNKITNYATTPGRKVKKEMIDAAATPSKQSRKNGTTPELLKPALSTHDQDAEMVDGMHIYDDPSPSPLVTKESQSNMGSNEDDNQKMPSQQDKNDNNGNIEATPPERDAAVSGSSNQKATPTDDSGVNNQSHTDSTQMNAGEKNNAVASGNEDTTSTENTTSCSSASEEKQQYSSTQETTQGSANPDASPNNQKESNDSSNAEDKTSDSNSTKVMVQETIPAIIHRKHSYRLLFSFKAKNYKKKNQTLEYVAGVLRQTILGVLLGGREIANDFGINAWRSTDKVQTILVEKDLPEVRDQLIKYTKPGGKIKPGQVNWFWGINVTCKLEMNIFIKYRREKMPGRNHKSPTYFHPIKQPPFQSEEWFELGWFVGSTEDQYTQALNTGLSNEIGTNIKLEWNNVVFQGVKKFWDIARKKRKETQSDEEFKLLLPKALVVLSDESSKRKEIEMSRLCAT